MKDCWTILTLKLSWELCRLSISRSTTLHLTSFSGTMQLAFTIASMENLGNKTIALFGCLHFIDTRISKINYFYEQINFFSKIFNVTCSHTYTMYMAGWLYQTKSSI